MIAVMVIVLRAGTHMRFDSLPPREKLLEARPLTEDALVVWGTAQRNRYDIGLYDGSAWIIGTLWDRIAPAVSFGDVAVRFHTRVSIDCAVLPEGCDGSWQREA